MLYFTLVVYGDLPVCKHVARWLIGTTEHVYPVSSVMPGASAPDGLFARQLPVGEASYKLFDQNGVCWRRFDLFAIFQHAQQSWWGEPQ